MTTQQILAILSLALPAIGLALPGIFKQDKLSPVANGIIATAIVILFAALQAWAEGQLNVINPWADFIFVLAGISALLAGPFKPVDTYLQSNVGLGTSKQITPVPPTQPLQGVGFAELISILSNVVTALTQHTQATAALVPALQSIAATPTIAPAAAIQEPVYGPGDNSTTDTAQPVPDGLQASIPAFTPTSEIPAMPK